MHTLGIANSWESAGRIFASDSGISGRHFQRIHGDSCCPILEYQVYVEYDGSRNLRSISIAVGGLPVLFVSWETVESKLRLTHDG